MLAILSVGGGYLLENNHLLQHWLYPEGLTLLKGEAVSTTRTARSDSTCCSWASARASPASRGASGGTARASKGEREEDWADWRCSAGEQFGYDATVMDAGVEGGGAIAKLAWWFDANVVDGIVNAVGFLSSEVGRLLKAFQTGLARTYALMMLIGSVALVAYHFLASQAGGVP